MTDEQYDFLIEKLNEIIALLKEDESGGELQITLITLAEYEKAKADDALIIIKEIAKQVKRRGAR